MLAALVLVLLNDRTSGFSWFRATVNSDSISQPFLCWGESWHKIAVNKVNAEVLGGSFQETGGSSRHIPFAFCCSFMYPEIWKRYLQKACLNRDRGPHLRDGGVTSIPGKHLTTLWSNLQCSTAYLCIFHTKERPGSILLSHCYCGVSDTSEPNSTC